MKQFLHIKSDKTVERVYLDLTSETGLFTLLSLIPTDNQVYVESLFPKAIIQYLTKNKKIALVNGGYIKTYGCPVIECDIREDFFGGLQFYCEYCKELHKHGWGEGHRASHCTNRNSPLSDKGYVIVLKLPVENEKEIRELWKDYRSSCLKDYTISQAGLKTVGV